MKSPTKTPLSIKIVAFVFIAIGIIVFAASLLVFSNEIGAGPDALSVSAITGALIFCVVIACVGIGLLRLSPKSLSFALCAVWIAMGVAASSVALISLMPQSGYLWNGTIFSMFPTVPSILLSLLFFAAFYWKFCVLIHSKTRRLFDPLDY